MYDLPTVCFPFMNGHLGGDNSPPQTSVSIVNFSASGEGGSVQLKVSEFTFFFELRPNSHLMFWVNSCHLGK